jgi:Cu/Ag efflux protein CusF
MKKALTLLAALTLSTSLWAQALTEGEVTKVDKPAGKITLRHGEIKNLDMPAMTMSFRVSNPQWLDELAPGQKVKFAAEKVGGQFTVVKLEK